MNKIPVDGGERGQYRGVGVRGVRAPVSRLHSSPHYVQRIGSGLGESTRDATEQHVGHAARRHAVAV